MGNPDQQNWSSELWSKVQSDLRNSMDERRYDFWVKPIRFISASPERVVLSCANTEERDRLVPRFGSKIAELIQQHAQIAIPVDFVVEVAKPQLVDGSAPQHEAESTPTRDGGEGMCPPLLPQSIVLNADTTFETLVVVPSGEPVGEIPSQAPTTPLYRRITIRDVVRQTAAFYGIRVADLLSRSRERPFVKPRQRAIYLARTMLERSYPQIATQFELDHTSCIHSFRRVEKEIATSPQVALEMETLRQAILAWSLQAGEAPTLQ